MTAAEVAAHLHMSPTHVNKLIDAGILPTVSSSGQRRVLAHDVDQLKVQLRVGRRELADRFARADQQRSTVIDLIASEL